MKKYNYRHRTNSTSPSWIAVICLVIAVIAVGLCMYRPFNKVSNIREVITSVTDKAVKNYGDSGKYLVFTKNKNGEVATFEITDSLFAGRFNSSDVYAGIEIGETYKFTIGGSRNEFVSWYPNIYDYEWIKEGE